MNRTLKSLLTLTIVSVKMYFRNRSAVFFTLFLPLAFIGVFGLLSKSSAPIIKIDLTDQSNSQLATTFVTELQKISTFSVTKTSEVSGANQLGKGKIDLQVIIPASFGMVDPKTHQIESSHLITHYNQADPGNGQTANLVLGQILSTINASISKTPQIVSLDSTGVKTNNLTEIDFLLPGILGMTIMQLGIFSVAFAFVSMKTTGMLRRIQATPTHPINFIIAQAVTRLIIGVLDVALLVGLGIVFFGFRLLGNMAEFMLFAVLGTLVFLAFGFAVAGYAKDENSAAPIANLISFPMLLLSGVFFPSDSFPSWLRTVTSHFPLTYLVDALRSIANQGTPITQLGGDLLGLVAWGLIMFFVAIRLFHWE
jgi:ABC-2 type transport system permease protein